MLRLLWKPRVYTQCSGRWITKKIKPDLPLLFAGASNKPSIRNAQPVSIIARSHRSNFHTTKFATFPDLGYSSKAVSEWSQEDVLQWFHDFRPISDTNKHQQYASLLNGEKLEKLDQSGLMALGIHEDDARNISLRFSSYLADAGHLDNESRIRDLVRQTAERMQAVLQRCKNIAYQKRIISPRLKNCLPLATSCTKWETTYFTDIRESPTYEKFCTTVKTSVASSQNAALLHLIQMSGTGKTHIAKQFIVQNGGIFISFRDEQHLGFITEAERIIANEKAKYRFMHAGVGTYAEEYAFTTLATDILTLIPLSFVEYATYFYAEASALGMSVEEQRDAFVRATLNGGQALVYGLWKKNIAIRFRNVLAFSTFKDSMVAFAKEKKMSFFYDEVQICQSKHVGEFLHSASPNDNSQVDQTKPQLPPGGLKGAGLEAFLLERLRAERQGTIKARPGVSNDFKRPTSLLYLLAIAMEDFAREQLPQITASTAYSATMLANSDGQLYSRHRLRVESFILNPDPDDVTTRFGKLIKHAYGATAYKYLKSYAPMLQKLSCRSVYLFDVLQMDLGDDPKKPLSQFIAKLVSTADTQAAKVANNYLTRASQKPHLKENILSIILQVSLAGKPVELDFSTVESLTAAGIISLPNDVRSKSKLKVNSSNVDPYLRQEMHAFALGNLVAELPRMVKLAAPIDIGAIGEYMLNLHLKLKAQESALISQLSAVMELNLHNTVAEQYYLSPKVHADNWEDSEDVIIFEKYKDHADVLLCPSTITRPDTIGVLLSTKTKTPSGFLLAQSKNHKTSLNPNKLRIALNSLDPNCMYSGHDQLKQRLANALAALPNDFAWIRIVFAKGFTDAAWKDISAYNLTDHGKKYPIILITTNSLPPPLQKINVTKPIRSHGSPETTKTKKSTKPNVGIDITAPLGEKRIKQLETEYGIDWAKFKC